MKIRIPDRDIIKMDAAVKINVSAKGDYKDIDVLLSRIIWNICFNPREKKRCMKLLDGIVNKSELKDLPECKGSMPIIK